MANVLARARDEEERLAQLEAIRSQQRQKHSSARK